MSEQHEFNKFNGKIIEVIRDVFLVNDTVKEFIEKGSQIELDKLCDSVNSVDKKWENLKESLLLLVKSVSGDESSIIVNKTDDGIEL